MAIADDGHRHCDFDPIECSFDALVGEYNELRRKYEALTAYVERRSWWRRLWRISQRDERAG